MEFEAAMRKLRLFGIPGGGGAAADDVRVTLARLLVSRAVSPGELQTARDIVKRAEKGMEGTVPDAAYVFLAAMFVSLHDGNTVFNLGNDSNREGKLLVDACRRKAEDEDSAAVEALGESVRSIWPDAVGAADRLRGDVMDFKTAYRDGKENVLWFFSRQREAVGCVSALIGGRLESTGETLTDGELNSVIAYKDRNGVAFTLGEEQKSAVRSTVEHKLAVITGGPGTGKTTIVCSILRALLGKSDLKPADVALAAPTGRAAQRMGEALRAQCAMAACGSDADRDICEAIGNIEGTSVHSLLGGYGPRWTHNEENPLPHRLVIVDECSMVDLLLMRSLLSALRDDCRLVLLGDKNQLPSVEAGAVLGDLAEMARADGNRGAFVELTRSRRFTGRLRVCAEEFNRGESTTIRASKLPKEDGVGWIDALGRPDTENGCFWRELSGERMPAKTDRAVKEWAGAYGLVAGGALIKAARAVGNDERAFAGECTDSVRKLFEVLDASRILAVVKNGPFGVRHINELLLRERLGRNPADPLVDDGIPVVVTENTRESNLFNGDVGVTVKRPGRGVHVFFPRGEKVVCCPAVLLPDHELAYAMTVHKSQGSEFENVMVVLPEDESHPLLNRQIVYTGITRAKKRAVVVGSEKALTAALGKNVERDTGIEAWRPRSEDAGDELTLKRPGMV